MTEGEKFKDLEYVTYLHDVLLINLEDVKDKRKESTEPVCTKLIDDIIEQYEKMLCGLKIKK